MKYYNFETMFISLATRLGDYLHNNGVYFELSKNGRYYHFEIFTDSDGATLINNYIDQFCIVEEA